MFCCTRNPLHQGQIVTSICTDQQCIQRQSQLCCSQCMLSDEHVTHNIITMKNMLPQLLSAHNQKNIYLKIIKDLLDFTKQQLDEDINIQQAFGGVGALSIFNVVEAIKITIINLRKKSLEENKKIKEIQKTLQIKSNSSIPQAMPQSINKYSHLMANSHISEYKPLHQVPMVSSHLQYPPIDHFSHTLKHPYITVSSDGHSAFKNSHAGGYKLAILSTNNFPISHGEPSGAEAKIRIVKSQGNILIGLGIPEIIKEKEYINCYGSGQGAFLLGQNNNDKKSSITFHSTDTIYNRKELVGWNFFEGDVIGLNLSKKDETYFLNFRKFVVKENGKHDFNKTANQYMMPMFQGEAPSNKEFHLLVLLNNVGDQVNLISEDQ